MLQSFGLSLNIPANPSDPSDDDLAIRMAKHDYTALDQIYDRYSSQAFGLCVYILGDNQLSENVLQESFRQVWNQSGSFNPAQTCFVTWLLSIVHHCAIVELRQLRSGADPKVNLNANLSKTHLTHNPITLSMEPLLANLQDGQMKVVLGQLTIRQCTIIMMSFYGGYTLHEIAVCLEEPPERIHTCAQTGMATLRNLLAF